MLVVENNEARIVWDGKVVFSTVYSAEIEVLEMIRDLVSKYYFWVEKARESDEMYERYSSYAEYLRVEANAICKTLNMLWKLNNKIYADMFIETVV